MTAIDSSIILPPQAKPPQNPGAGRKEDTHAEKTTHKQKQFTDALTETPQKKEVAPSKTDAPVQTAETSLPERPQNASRNDNVKGKAIETLLEKLAQGTEIDPALLEKAQAGDTDALKEILLSLGIEAESSDLENIPATDPQGQIIAVLAQLLQQQRTVTQAPATQSTATQAAPTSPPSSPLSQGATLLLAQEGEQLQQTQQTATQQKNAETAVKEQPRPAPAQPINAQQQPQQPVQQQTTPQQQTNSASQIFANSFGDGSPDGGLPQQGGGAQTGPDGQFLPGQDGKSAQQSGLPQFTTAKAAGSFQSPAMHKIFLTMQRNAAERTQQMTLRLEPAAMGRVAVTMIFGKDGAMKAHLLVEKPETYQMLSRDSNALEKALKEAGLDLGDNALSFDLASGQEQFEKPEAQRDSGRGFHFHMQGEDSEMTAAEQAAVMMNATHANDTVLTKGSINIVI